MKQAIIPIEHFQAERIIASGIDDKMNFSVVCNFRGQPAYKENDWATVSAEDLDEDGNLGDMMGDFKIWCRPSAQVKINKWLAENAPVHARGGELSGWKRLFADPSKFIPYHGQFLYPPRIELRLQPKSLDRLSGNDYVGQPKLNGSNTSTAVSEDMAIAKNRHNTFFEIPPKFDFKALHRGKGWMSFAGEFMNKSKKDHTGQPFRGFCIWDIMAFENQILIGSTIEERIKLIDMLYPSREPAVVVSGITLLYHTDTPGIYKVANFYGNFTEIYNKIIAVDMVEGFVLKRKNGKLEHMTREANNTGWAVKVRKPTANYRFATGGTGSLKPLWYVVDGSNKVKNISTSKDAAHTFLDKSLKNVGDVFYTELPLADWESEKINVSNIRQLSQNKYKMWRGGAARLGFNIGTRVGMMRGENKGEKGYISNISTVYEIKLRDKTIIAHEGDFYNEETN
jgi:hypothetical protein